MKRLSLKHALGLPGLATVSVVLSPHVHLFDNPDAQAIAAVVETGNIQDRPISSLRDLNSAFTDIAAKVKPTVVTVFTEKTLRYRQSPFMGNPFLDFFYGPNRPQQDMPEQEFRQVGSVLAGDAGYQRSLHVRLLAGCDSASS